MIRAATSGQSGGVAAPVVAAEDDDRKTLLTAASEGDFLFRGSCAQFWPRIDLTMNQPFRGRPVVAMARRGSSGQPRGRRVGAYGGPGACLALVSTGAALIPKGQPASPLLNRDRPVRRPNSGYQSTPHVRLAEGGKGVSILEIAGLFEIELLSDLRGSMWNLFKTGADGA